MLLAFCTGGLAFAALFLLYEIILLKGEIDGLKGMVQTLMIVKEHFLRERKALVREMKSLREFADNLVKQRVLMSRDLKLSEIENVLRDNGRRLRDAYVRLKKERDDLSAFESYDEKALEGLDRMQKTIDRIRTEWSECVDAHNFLFEIEFRELECTRYIVDISAIENFEIAVKRVCGKIIDIEEALDRTKREKDVFRQDF